MISEKAHEPPPWKSIRRNEQDLSPVPVANLALMGDHYLDLACIHVPKDLRSDLDTWLRTSIGDEYVLQRPTWHISFLPLHCRLSKRQLEREERRLYVELATARSLCLLSRPTHNLLILQIDAPEFERLRADIVAESTGMRGKPIHPLHITVAKLDRHFCSLAELRPDFLNGYEFFIRYRFPRLDDLLQQGRPTFARPMRSFPARPDHSSLDMGASDVDVS